MTEHDIQVGIIQWSEYHKTKYPQLHMLYAIPNGQKRHPTVAAKLKKEGVRAGVWDLSLDWPSGGYFGLKIEVKRPKGRLSDSQKRWGENYTKAGYAKMVICSIDECCYIIDYLKLKYQDYKKEYIYRNPTVKI